MLAPDAPGLLLGRYGLHLQWLPDDADIPGSYWGAPEAGLVGDTVLVRNDTPVHSLLHEFAHVICMDTPRRRHLHTDAGGTDTEECAVCYLQILLADELPGVGRARLMRDMDAWGYSFRLGSTRQWFLHDAAEAREWLLAHALIDRRERPQACLRP
ncbi:hypothetical protein [Acidihalobacter prosperus]|nr:hypothetical protein [Acidihalobacter prosperus]